MSLNLPPATIGGNHQLTIRYVAIEGVKRLDGNPRIYSRSDRRRAKRILKRFGLRLPIVVDLDDNVIAGDLLLIAAIELGYTEVPTVYATGLSAMELQAMSISYNRLGETGEWEKASLGRWILHLEDGMIDFDKIKVAQTRNGGRDWQDLPDLALNNPDAAIAGLTLGPGLMVLAHNALPDSRAVLDLSASSDGLNWTRQLSLAQGDDRAEFSYPSLAWADDSLWVSYTDQRRAIAWQRLTLTRP